MTPSNAPHAYRLALGGRVWDLTEVPIRIGRAAGNQVVVDDPRVAPAHAVVVVDREGRWLVQDLGGPGGTWCAGRQVRALVVSGPTTLHLGGPQGAEVRMAAIAAPAQRAPIAPVPVPHAPPATPGAPIPPARPAPPVRPIAPAGPAPAGSPPPSPPAPITPPAAATGPTRFEEVTHLAHPVAPAQGPPAPAGRPVPGPGPGRSGRVRIGRSRENDLVVDDLLVSRFHAELRWDGHGWNLLDLGGPNGTYIDGTRTGTAELHLGQRITFGTSSYTVVPHGLAPAARPLDDGPTPPALEARHLTVEVDGGTRILDDVSFAVEPGQLLAIVGPSGSGKSTLLKALTGSRRPEAGTVQVRGVELYEAYEELCRSIGYVPQDDILHRPLTVRQALTFGAELRFPADTTDDDRRERVDEVLGELELSHRGDVPIEQVSGGQRKRTSVALELLTRPELLFLDEPTSGLDPGFERTVMELLRTLASAGRAVVVVTHSLQSLELCDRVLFLAPGGSVAYDGPPGEALAFFGRDDFIDVFRDLEDRAPAAWRARSSDDEPDPPSAALAAPRAAPPGQPWRRQVEILARRQLAILRADRQNLLFLAGAVLVPAVLILLLMGSDTLRLGQDEPVNARNILGAVVVAAVAIGAANAIREIVKEVPVYLRERAVGLQRSAYLTSKVVVLGCLTAVQAAVLVLVTTLRSGGPGRANLLLVGHLELIVAVVLTGVAAVSLGLLLSTLVSSSEKAMALVPVVFVVQWLFSGAALDLQDKPVMREVAQVTSANWGMAAAASTVDEHQLSQTCSHPLPVDHDDHDDPFAAPVGPTERQRAEERRELAPTCDRRWESDAASWLTSVLALLALAVVPLGIADRTLARKEPLAAQRASDWPFPWAKGPLRRF